MMFQDETTGTDGRDVWSRRATPVPQETISWRKDGNIVARNGRYFARFVAYIEANTVRERLDSVVPGEWDLLLELLPSIDPGQNDDGATCAFRARLQIRGVMREDVGMGRDYKQAATDAFKRAAVRFGIAHELYAYDVNWVEMDGDSRYAKPREDPAGAYERRHTHPHTSATVGSDFSHSAPIVVAADGDGDTTPNAERRTTPRKNVGATRVRERAATLADSPSCPKCNGPMWDNRPTKRNPNAPDFRCKDRACDAVIWPTRLVAVGDRASSSSDAPTPSLALGGAADAADAL